MVQTRLLLIQECGCKRSDDMSSTMLAEICSLWAQHLARSGAEGSVPVRPAASHLLKKTRPALPLRCPALKTTRGSSCLRLWGRAPASENTVRWEVRNTRRELLDGGGRTPAVVQSETPPSTCSCKGLPRAARQLVAADC